MPKKSTKKRVMSYQRASWHDEEFSRMTLQQTLSQCLSELPNADDTRVDLRGGQAEIRHRKETKKRIYLHVASWTDRENASIVPHNLQRADADLSERSPGSDWDYLDGDGMILVSENHVVTLSSGMHPRSIEQYIRELIEQIQDEDMNFQSLASYLEFTPVANPNAVKILHNNGVKKINLNISQYLETTLQYEDRRRPRKIIQNLGRDIIASLVTKDKHREEIEHADNVTARLIISLDGRRPGLQPDTLAEIVQKPVEENPREIEFETGTGQRVRSGELILKKSVDVVASGKTVDHSDAWAHMKIYFQELRKTGMLDE